MTSRSRTGTWSRVPWWAGVVAGLAAAGLGVVLLLRPLWSVGVLTALVAAGLVATGVATLGEQLAHDRSPWPRRVGLAWIAAGAALLAWPGVTTDALAVVVGVSLLAGGAWDVVAGARGRTDDRAAAVLGGVASLVFGVLALSWPDVTLLVVSVAFGFRLVALGLRVAWSTLRQRDGAPRAGRRRVRPDRRRRAARLAVSGTTLALALGLAGLSAQLHRSDSLLDAFYDTPDEVPPEPGALLRSEPFDRALPERARAWRILYTTTASAGVPAVASGIVVVPDRADGRADASTPTPVIAWAHGTTGVARRCAPSALPDPWTAGALFSLPRVLDEGWALVAPDYIGLGAEGAHPYLVGEPAGRSVLDAVRAARRLGDVELADETVVWGHSQGGGAALWTGILAPTYAPDAGVAGIAALAPASDLVGLFRNIRTMTGGSIFASYALRGFADAYDDVRVDDYVRPVGRTTFDQATRRCLDGTALASALSSLVVGMDVFRGDLTSGPLLGRLAANVPTGPIEAPVLVAQGGGDGLVLPAVQDAYVAARCAAGHPVDHRTYPGLGHVALVQADSPLLPELLEWTRARFAGRPAASTC